MITKKSLWSWVFYKNTKWQVLLLAIIVVTVSTRLLPLEMQKRIINQAIGLKDLQALFWYCGFYLAAVVLAGVLKMAINSIQTYIGQRTLIHIRQQLYEHILSLPLNFFRRTQPGFVISAMIAELAAVAELIGAAVAVPVVNILTLIAFAGYMFYLNPLLAGLSLAIYPLEMFFIPRLQRRANQSNRERINATRDTSGLIGEAISGVHEVQANASYELEGEKFHTHIRRLFHLNVRMQIYRYGIKFVNNLFQSLGPFILFLVGGYLAINGRFDLGALVAFLSAYEKVYDPWKELMDFYQLYQDAIVRYQQIMDYFDEQPEYDLVPSGREAETLLGNIDVSELYYLVSGNLKLLDRVSLKVEHGQHLALVGFSGSGKSTLALCIGQIYKNSAGQITIDGKDLSSLTKLDVANNVGIVAQHPFIFNGTVRDNLLYSCLALQMQKYGEPKPGEMPDLDRIIEVVQQVGLFLDVLRFGLRHVIHVGEYGDMIPKIIKMRAEFQETHGQALAGDVEFFDRERFLQQASVAENLIFGDFLTQDQSAATLYKDREFVRILEEADLLDALLQLGANLATETVDILQNLPQTPEIFEESPIGLEEFEEYRALVAALKNTAPARLGDARRQLLLKLALGFVPGVHKMVALPADFQDKVLAARDRLVRRLQELYPQAYHVFDRQEYIHAQNILENVVFGHIRTDSAGASDRVNQAVIQMLITENLLEEIVAVGLDFHVGSAGDRLSGGQRQKIALARTFLKDPPIFIMDEATAALDNASQSRIQNLLEQKYQGKATVVAVVHRLDTIKNFDLIAVMKTGKIVEMGGYDQLLSQKGALYELVHGKK